MTAAVLAPTPNFQPLDNNGKVVPGGKLFTYDAGTTNKRATFTDSGGGTPNTNPVVMDANGRANVWLSPTIAYKFVFSPSTDTDPPTGPFWTVDVIGGSVTTGAVSGTTGTFTGAVSGTTLTGSTSVSGPLVQVTGGASPSAGTSQAQLWNNSGGILSLVDSSRTVNNRIAELIFTAGTLLGRFANDADNAFATWLTVTGGQGAGLTSVALATLLDLSAAAAGQIKFPATQNPSADANTLDQYQEGTWTPSVGGTATYTTQLGTYTKAGRLSFIDATVTINVIGTGSKFDVTGVPFTAAKNAALTVMTISGSVTNIVSIAGSLGSGTTDVILRSRTAASASDAANDIFQNGTSVVFSGCFST